MINVSIEPDCEREYIRDMAKAYTEYALSPVMEARREAWSELHALNFTRPLIYIRSIPFGEFFDRGTLKCTSEYNRRFEINFLYAKYQSMVCDDFICEPYMTVRASVNINVSAWGMPIHMTARPQAGGAAAYDPVIIEEEDFNKLCVAPHKIDESATRANYDRLADLFGDITDIYVDRQGALCSMWSNDISTDLAKLRGLEQIMWDVYDRPEWFHKLLAFMRDKILKNMDEAEAAGDFSGLNHQNQAMPYLKGLNRPGGSGTTQKQLWGYMAAQEFTAFGPDLFAEFMFDYQKPILERYAVTAYGCCEDLTRKIGIIKSLKNLRRISVSPFADLKSCAEQIGGDYIISWRPNPSDMVSWGVDEEYVRNYIRRGIDLMKQNGCKYDITLKDVETVSGSAAAIIDWTRIVRDEINKSY